MFWLLACSSPWTREAALAPLVAHLDQNKDGKLDAAEYERVGYAAPRFGTADTDGDGALSVAELDRTVFLQDPITFDGSLERTPPDLSLGPGVSGTLTAQQRLLWELLTCLRDDVRAKRSDLVLPDDLQILQAANTGRIDSYEARVVLADLKQAWTEAGLVFPQGL
jgi:hypothetical protein